MRTAALTILIDPALASKLDMDEATVLALLLAMEDADVVEWEIVPDGLRLINT